MPTARILTDYELNETYYYIGGRQIDPADYAPPETICIHCREERLPQFSACHNCDPDAFYDEAHRLTVYDQLAWLDDLMVNTGGTKSFCTDRGALVLEYKAKGYALDQAAVVLTALGVSYNKRPGALDVTLMPGWNGRYVLKR